MEETDRSVSVSAQFPIVERYVCMWRGGRAIATGPLFFISSTGGPGPGLRQCVSYATKTYLLVSVQTAV